jgi:hypothetical protein
MGDDYEFSDAEMREMHERIWASKTGKPRDATVPVFQSASQLEPRFDVADAWSALEEAKQGDWRALEKRVRSGIDLCPTERAFVADIIAGKIKRPKHNPLDFEAQRRRRKIASYVVWGETQTSRKKPTIADAMRVFGVSRAGVFDALKHERKRAEVLRDRYLQLGCPEVISAYYWKPGEQVPEDRRRRRRTI